MSIGRVTNAAFRCAAAATLLLATPASAQNRGEVDPAAVSDGLKAIFNYSTNSKSTRDRLNANTITLIGHDRRNLCPVRGGSCLRAG